MTISSTNTKNSYSGDGSTVAFSYTFKILDDDDIQVILRTNATGAETVQTKTTHYSVSGVGNAGGGTITFVSAPAATETVVLIRAIPLTQTTDYTPNDPFPAVTHEDALDKLTLMAQDTQEEVDRSIKLSRTNTMTSTEFTVGATDRANKVFAFDSSGELAVTQEIGTFQGDWAASTAYAERDLVKDTSTNNIFIVNSAHTSSGSQPLTTNTNSSKYDLIVDAAAATTSATNAASSATAAAASATAAAASESAAATSETNAAASEAGVAADAAAAAASASSASTSASNASTSETNASNSASAAATSATNAATSATNASNSASAASTSASNAATSESNASDSADAASTSASNAASSASSASTSETNAASSASGAASDASAAAASAAAAAASFDAFDDIYLGAKASAPTVDNDGDALTEGDQYFNTTNDTLFVWNGSAWQAASPDIVGDTTPQLGGDLDTNGNDINFGDNAKAVFGDAVGGDLQIYHNGSNSYIQEIGTGNLFIASDANVNITNQATSELKATFISNGAVNLYYDNAPKFATTSSGIDVTGNATFDDNGKAIFGAGSDLQIYHDGTHSYISDATGTGNLYLQSSSYLVLETGNGNENYLVAQENGPVTLYYDSAAKVATTSSGIDVTGTVTADGLTVDGAAQINAANANLVFFETDTTNLNTIIRNNGGQFKIQSATDALASTERVLLDHATGDISFYDSTGTTQGLFWDASTQRLGLGSTSPGATLHVDAPNTTAPSLTFGAAAGQIFQNENSELAIGLSSSDPYPLYMQGRTSGNASRNISLQPLGGNLLVGKTGTSNQADGFALIPNGASNVVRDGGAVMQFNRKTSDGDILQLLKGSTEVGVLGSYGNDLYLGTEDTGLTFNNASDLIAPVNPSTGATRDDAIDLGATNARFDDIYATNGTIQTSDANEKQDIEALSDAEQRVAVAAKGLLRKYRWKSSVAEKGDEARIHFGIIAQDLKAAFEAEGLDAGRYAMFINSEWTDEETGEQRSRMGVRYNQLLAFIIAAI